MSKVKFNIKNLHWALESEVDTYEPSPKSMTGATNLTLDIEGSETIFWADGVMYFVSNNVNGYKGEVTVAKVPDDFRKEVYEEELDAKQVLIETKKPISKRIALGFEIETDKKSELFWYYGVTCGKPSVNAKTTEGDNTPETETFSINVAGLADGIIRARTTQETDDETRQGWFKTVYKKSDVAVMKKLK